jgi:hypothetical protein
MSAQKEQIVFKDSVVLGEYVLEKLSASPTNVLGQLGQVKIGELVMNGFDNFYTGELFMRAYYPPTGTSAWYKVKRR